MKRSEKKEIRILPFLRFIKTLIRAVIGSPWIRNSSSNSDWMILNPWNWIPPSLFLHYIARFSFGEEQVAGARIGSRLVLDLVWKVRRGEWLRLKWKEKRVSPLSTTSCSFYIPSQNAVVLALEMKKLQSVSLALWRLEPWSATLLLKSIWNAEFWSRTWTSNNSNSRNSATRTAATRIPCIFPSLCVLALFLPF